VALSVAKKYLLWIDTIHSIHSIIKRIYSLIFPFDYEMLALKEVSTLSSFISTRREPELSLLSQKRLRKELTRPVLFFSYGFLSLHSIKRREFLIQRRSLPLFSCLSLSFGVELFQKRKGKGPCSLTPYQSTWKEPEIEPSLWTFLTSVEPLSLLRTFLYSHSVLSPIILRSFFDFESILCKVGERERKERKQLDREDEAEFIFVLEITLNI